MKISSIGIHSGPSLVPRLSPQKRGRREPGNIQGKSCQLPPPWSGSTNQIAERNHVYTWHFLHSAKSFQLENELVSVDYTSKVGEKQFSDVWKGLKSRESKIKVCCSWLRDRLAHHPLQLRVYMYEVRHGTQYNCRCLEDEERNCK